MKQHITAMCFQCHTGTEHHLRTIDGKSVAVCDRCEGISFQTVLCNVCGTNWMNPDPGICYNCTEQEQHIHEEVKPEVTDRIKCQLLKSAIQKYISDNGLDIAGTKLESLLGQI